MNFKSLSTMLLSCSLKISTGSDYVQNMSIMLWITKKSVENYPQADESNGFERIIPRCTIE